MANIRFFSLLSICIAHVLCGFAQTGTIFFNDKWAKIDSREGASFFRIVSLKDDKYKVADYYINGDKQMIGYYGFGAKNLLTGIGGDDGYRNGQFEYYYSNGQLSSAGLYKTGNKEREWKYYDSLGNLLKTEHYEKGLREGDFIAYYPNGKVQHSAVFRNNQMVSEKHYDEKGKK